MSTSELLLSTDGCFLQTRYQNIAEWKIKNFFDLKETHLHLDSPYFKCFGVEWYLRLYPYGNAAFGWVSMFLRKQPSSSGSRSVSFSLGAKKADGSAFIYVGVSQEYPEAGNYSAGSNCFIQRSTLLQYRNVVAPGNTLTVFCAFHLESEDAVAGGRTSQTSSMCDLEMLSNNLKELYLSGSEGDTKITVQGKVFTSHKAILTVRCPVFRSMLEADMAEKSTGAVNIEDCDPDCFHDFLLFLYSGKLDVVSPLNAMGLYYIADKYDVKQLKEACRVCMTREVSVESVCDIVHLASLHNEPELLDAATEFFMCNANSVVTSPRWISFFTEHPTIANELLVELTNKCKCMSSKLIKES